MLRPLDYSPRPFDSDGNSLRHGSNIELVRNFRLLSTCLNAALLLHHALCKNRLTRYSILVGTRTRYSVLADRSNRHYYCQDNKTYRRKPNTGSHQTMYFRIVRCRNMPVCVAEWLRPPPFNSRLTTGSCWPGFDPTGADKHSLQGTFLHHLTFLHLPDYRIA